MSILLFRFLTRQSYRLQYFKGCIAPKEISHIKQTGEPRETCYAFEGFMDYLSFLTLRLESYSANPNFDRQEDYMILNTVTYVSKALYPLGSYEQIHCFFDNDKAGVEALQELQKEYGLRIRDASHIYAGDNDLNDYLRGKRFGQSEQQKKKLKPEEKERQIQQPKKKGRGIGM